MAARGSFQKRQKEAARREKRQLKLERRHGKQPAHQPNIAGGESGTALDATDSIDDDTPLVSSADPMRGNDSERP
jgi:hypothetical protein